MNHLYRLYTTQHSTTHKKNDPLAYPKQEAAKTKTKIMNNILRQQQSIKIQFSMASMKFSGSNGK